MKIAVPVTSSNQIDGHFGHCEFYNIFTISEEKKIADVQTMASPQGCGCKSNIASTLAQNGVTVMLAGGIGEGAVNVLQMSGISVIRGCSGDAHDTVNMFINGTLTDSGETCMEHHHHGNGNHSEECPHH